MAELVDIGAAHLDASTNTVLVQAKSAQIGSTPDDAPSFDDTPVFGQLGVTAVPAAKDDRGNAQGTLDESVPGHNGVITSIRDARAAGIVQELGPGETAIHSTGKDFDSLVLLKKRLAAIMVGDDHAVVIDGINHKATVSIPGVHIEASSEQGGSITLTAGGATLRLAGGAVSLLGSVVLGGMTPVAPVCYSPTPVVGVTGSTVPALGVFIGV
jgi:hypothetical protein